MAKNFPDDTRKRLGNFLTSLPVGTAVNLARVAEMSRAIGDDSIPTEFILDHLREQIRKVQPRRIPTLQRLICTAFEMLLTDRDSGTARVGVVPRAMIQPWWALIRKDIERPFASLQAEYAAALAAENDLAIEELARQARKLAVDATRTLIQKAQSNSRGKRFVSLRLGGRERIQELGDVLGMLETYDFILPWIKLIRKTAQRELPEPLLDNQLIPDLGPKTVFEIKNIYLRLCPQLGDRTVYFFLALLKSLASPWHALRLPRSLSWKENDAMVRNTDVAIIFDYLVDQAEDMVAELSLVFPQRQVCVPTPARFQRSADLVKSFNRLVAGILEEFPIRRDSPWAARIDAVRALFCDVVEHLLGTATTAVLSSMPQRRSGHNLYGRDAFTSDSDTMLSDEERANAIGAARMIAAVSAEGDRHGLGRIFHACFDRLHEGIDSRSAELILTLRHEPDSKSVQMQLSTIASALRLLPKTSAFESLQARIDPCLKRTWLRVA